MTNNKKVDDPTEGFVYETKDGQKVELLAFGRLPAGVFRKARKSNDEMSTMFDIVEAATTEEGLDIVDTLTLEELGELFEQWSEAASTDLPKA